MAPTGEMRENRSHLPTKISAKDRANQYPRILHESGGKLFCTPCNLVLEHKVRDRLTERKREGERMRKINIPLSTSDHPVMRKFLNEKVTNGRAIPGFHQLQEQYLEAVYEKEKEDSTGNKDCAWKIISYCIY
uniref:Uncharacterized protein n=1 Tax=Myripristis murdjan TaxID=586833 RepID=A0A667XG38_9TELE